MILIALSSGSTRWAELLSRELAAVGVDQDVVTMSDDNVDPAAVEFVVMWRYSPEKLDEFTNLRGILLSGAGFDHLNLATMPHVPVVRLIDPAMAHDIASYVLMWTIYFQRDFDKYSGARKWMAEPQPPRFTRDVTVGILGMGVIGTVVRDMCEQHGYTTLGWSRTNHDRPLLDFFQHADVVVDLVPLSDDTRGLIGGAELAALDDGVLINVGRGATVDTNALISALDGPLRGAVLDVFEAEPLPSCSKLWDRQDVIITPHVAGRTDPVTAVPIIAANIAEILAGELPAATINRDLM